MGQCLVVFNAIIYRYMILYVLYACFFSLIACPFLNIAFVDGEVPGTRSTIGTLS